MNQSQICRPHHQDTQAIQKSQGIDDSYKGVYGSVYYLSASNPVTQMMYINEHICYAFKFGILTNRMYIV